LKEEEMAECMIVEVNAARGIVTKENGVEMQDFPYWKERYTELQTKGWVTVKFELKEELNTEIFILEKKELVQWRYLAVLQGDCESLDALNARGAEGWELVSSVRILAGTTEKTRHILKMRTTYPK
jgi:hypothetical protein